MELDYKNPDPLVATTARLFAVEGRAKEVATLAHSIPVIVQTGYDSWGNGTTHFELVLQVPHYLFAQLEPDLEAIQVAALVPPYRKATSIV